MSEGGIFELPTQQRESARDDSAPKETSKSKRRKRSRKISKKELLRLRKEEERRRKEEEERLEQERRDQREREEEAQRREEEKQRLTEERESIIQMHEERRMRGENYVRLINDQTEWHTYVSCDHSIDTKSEKDVNAFLSQWEENDAIDAIDSSNEVAIAIFMKLLDLKDLAMLREDVREQQRCQSQLEHITQLVTRSMDAKTMHYLVFSDKYVTAKNELMALQHYGPYIFGLWVNLSKNPKNKDLDFGAIHIAVPKPVSMASVAIRVIKYPAKATSPEWQFIGDSIECQFIQLLQPPKRLQEMTLRQCPASTHFNFMQYPLKNVTAVQPPLAFTVDLDPHIVTPHIEDVKVFRIVDGVPTTKQIVRSELLAEENKLTFSALCNGIFAFGVPKYKYLPFTYWEISPTEDNLVEIYLQTENMEIALYVDTDGFVSMNSPIVFEKFSPANTFEFLGKHGINLIAPDDASIFIVDGSRLVSKDRDVEATLHSGIADIAPCFKVTCNTLGSFDKSDRAIVLIKDASDENSSQHIILVKANHITEVVYDEDKQTYSSKAIEKTTRIHESLTQMAFDYATDATKEKINSCSAFMYNSIHYILERLRLFSITC